MGKYFDHQKLIVYQVAIEFVVFVEEIIPKLPIGRAYLVDQIQCAASSIVLNITEGAGEFSLSEKNRFYRMAKRSATEYASILDICNRLQFIDAQTFNKGHDFLLRIVSMLIKLSKTK